MQPKKFLPIEFQISIHETGPLTNITHNKDWTSQIIDTTKTRHKKVYA